MDKYEYRLKLDQLKNLVAAGDYETAEEIANTINWKKVRNSSTLCMVAKVYEENGNYEACRDVLLQAYDHSSIGRNIVSRLAEVAIKAKRIDEAEEYYSEFLEIAPKDNQRYVIAYEISCLKDAPLADRIAILEELKEKEYSEMWAYELAALYSQADMRNKCVETCDELILWFGDGEYVEKALDLKRRFQPLTPAQEEKYQKFRKKKGLVEINIPKKVEASISKESGLPEITVTASKFNTQNLQDELSRSMRQIKDATEKDTVKNTMESIKKIVNDIPYLSGEQAENEPPVFHREEITEKVDEGLKADFRELLGEESDGQISLQIPESRIAEQQVAGQMSIEEVLAEWEKTKRAAEAAIAAAEQKKLELAKEQALAEAGEIMARLQALFPILSAKEGEDIPAETETIADAVARGNEELVKSAMEAKAPERSLKSESAAQSADAGEAKTDSAEQAETENTDAAVNSDPTETDTAAGEISPDAEIKAAEENTSEADSHTEEEALPDTDTEAEISPEADAFTDAGDAEGTEPFTADENAEADEMPEVESMEATKEMPDLSQISVIAKSEVSPSFVNPSEDEELERLLASAAQGMMARSNVEVPVTGGIPQADIPQADIPQKSESGRMDTKNLEEDYRIDGSLDGESILTDEDRELFSYFLPVPGMEEQITQILKDANHYIGNSITSLRGNIVIQGEEGSGKTVLATSLIKAIQRIVGNEDAKIGKISAASLNHKDFAVLVPKIAGGYLIVDKAGDLTAETAVRMSQVMDNNTQGMVVILEDNSAGIKKALGLDFSFAKKFTGKIKIPIFTIDELVDFGKSYAEEMECVIEEMGVLALYNRINSIQKRERPTTLAEVKEIVDQAIESAESGGIKKLFSKKYNENDYLILREKDFEQS